MLAVYSHAVESNVSASKSYEYELLFVNDIVIRKILYYIIIAGRDCISNLLSCINILRSVDIDENKQNIRRRFYLLYDFRSSETCSNGL